MLTNLLWMGCGGLVVLAVWVARDLVSPVHAALARVKSELEKARRDIATLQAVNVEGRRLVDWALAKLACVRAENDYLETQLRLARERADQVEAERGKLHEQFMAVSAALETQARENTAQAAIIGKLRLGLEAAHRDLLMVTPEQLDKDRKGRE
jgi:molecular chaperone GrpE (heat shock protein)